MSEQAPEYRPLHIQIRDHLRERIARHEWSAHHPLPPEMVLAEEYNVSVGTMRRALDDLAASHLITRQRGKGTFVTQHSLHEALYRWFCVEPDDGPKRFPEDEIVGREEGAPREEEQRLLGVAHDGRVFRLFRRRLIDGRPIMHDVLVIDAERFPNFSWSAARAPTPYAHYEAAYQIKVIEVVERVKADIATSDDVKWLDVAPGSPVLVVQRVAFTFQNEAVELRTTRLSTASHSYVNRIT